MTIAELCLPAAVLVYLLTIGWAKYSAIRQFDNGDPRNEAFYADPVRRRARGAHVNGIETFPFFAAAVIVAEMRHAQQGLVDLLAVAFVVLRVAYVAAYIGDKPSLRSLLWTAGLVADLAMFFAPIYAKG